ncbi:MAG: glycosyltransferase family 4 protein [Erythrobacter sp.]
MTAETPGKAIGAGRESGFGFSIDRQTRSKPVVLHVSGDFPDPLEPAKTPVIKTLLDLTEGDFEHRVLSINRSAPSFGDLVGGRGPRIAAEPFEYGLAARYKAPPRGLLHRTGLHRLGDWLADRLEDEAIRPDLLVAHKLSIEGIAVHRAAARLGIPYAVSIQGDTDLKILGVRRDLAGEFREIIAKARMIFPFAPWAWDAVRARLGIGERPVVILPCPTDLDDPLPPRKGEDGPLTAFHLRNHRRKNLPGLARAMSALGKQGFAEPLTVLGGGDAATRAACERVIGDAPVVLAGPADRATLRAKMNRAKVFVLPSLRESFGLVFIEALFAGLPIIYPRGAGVDGFFDDAPFALAVDARDPRSIARAIGRAIERESEMKAALADWQASDHAQTFRRPAIGSAFREGLMAACADDRA